MSSICEKVITIFAMIFYGQKKSTSNIVEKKDEYTLSSVFPTQRIMDEAKKYL